MWTHARLSLPSMHKFNLRLISLACFSRLRTRRVNNSFLVAQFCTFMLCLLPCLPLSDYVWIIRTWRQHVVHVNYPDESCYIEYPGPFWALSVIPEEAVGIADQVRVVRGARAERQTLRLWCAHWRPLNMAATVRKPENKPPRFTAACVDDWEKSSSRENKGNKRRLPSLSPLFPPWVRWREFRGKSSLFVSVLMSLARYFAKHD